VAGLSGLCVIGPTGTRAAGLTTSCGPRRAAGRPGESRFFVSLEDDLIQRYGVMGLIPRSHRPRRQEAPVDDPVVRDEIARSQRIIEGQNFEIRKTLWRYSLMVDEQRRLVYRRRQAYLLDRPSPGCVERPPLDTIARS